LAGEIRVSHSRLKGKLDGKIEKNLVIAAGSYAITPVKRVE